VLIFGRSPTAGIHLNEILRGHRAASRLPGAGGLPFYWQTLLVDRYPCRRLSETGGILEGVALRVEHPFLDAATIAYTTDHYGEPCAAA
jgi:hypothetical protein